MKLIKPVILCSLMPILFACTTLTPAQKNEYSMMERDNVLVKEKDPNTGAWFGLLPGGGAFYGREPAVGVLDLLLWPVSVLWDPVVGFETSKTVNYKLTVSSLDKQKAKELAELENQKDLGSISNVEYVTKKREVEQKYNYGS